MSDAAAVPPAPPAPIDSAATTDGNVWQQIWDLPWLQIGIGLIVLLVLAWLSYVILRAIVQKVLSRLAAKTKTQWDDLLIQNKVFTRLSLLAPFVIVDIGIELIPGVSTELATIIQQIAMAGLALTGCLAGIAFLSAANDIYNTFEMAKERSIKGFVQIAQILVGIMAGVFVIANLTGTSTWGLLSGIGAMTAVVLLIFKDTILGLVASIQLAGNKMVRVGDWISMPKYGADGDVIDIALHTVKIRNFDKTIVTIPTQALINDSFQNWRGMKDTGGRRIKRCINIDVNTIRFLEDEEIERFAKIEVLKDYIAQKRKDIDDDNAKRPGDKALKANVRKLTNIGTLRAYLQAHLRADERIRTDLTFLVRQLEPTEHGLPIQIYIFTNTTVWAEYESIQADVFDHIFAILSEFDLRAYQAPSGKDIDAAAAALRS